MNYAYFLRRKVKKKSIFESLESVGALILSGRYLSASSKMRFLLQILIIAFFALGNSFAQTQVEMNQEAAEAFKLADTELNETYQQILKDYAEDSEFLTALRTSQRNWITFRDSELKMMYPDREPGWYGSIHSMCISSYMTELTTKRTAQLKLWLMGIEEGDACAGSIRTKGENEPELIEQFDDFDFVRLLNELEFLKSYRTDELSIKVMSSSNLPGSAGFASGEVTANIWIAVSEFDELPEQTLYRVNNLYGPKLVNFDGTNPNEPKLTLQFIDGEPKDITLQLSIEKIVKL